MSVSSHYKLCKKQLIEMNNPMNILGDYITAVQRATDINDHTGQYVAKNHNRLEGVDKLVKSAQAVETPHDDYVCDGCREEHDLQTQFDKE